MGEKGKTGGENIIVHLSVGLTWPFSLEQYQNGKIYAGAECDVISGYEKQGYEKLWDTVEEALADEKEKLFGKGDSK